MADNLGFAVTDAAHALRRAFDERARSIGVTRPHWRLLLTLSREEGLHQAALAERLEVEPITLCRMVDRLADAGLVERRADPADRRARRIHLLPAAHPVIARLKRLADDLSARALDGFAPGEADRLLDLLDRLRFNLTTTDEERRHG